MFVGHFGKARIETATRKKENREWNTALQLLLTEESIIIYSEEESRKTLRTGLEDACNQLPTFRFQQDNPDQRRAGKEIELRWVRSSTIRQGAPGSEGRPKCIVK